jgi:hypothetical protein
MDWTDEAHRTNSLRLSTWRTNPKHEKRDAGPIYALKMETRIVFPNEKHETQGESLKEITINIIPLHVFLDLGALSMDDGLLSFIAEVFGSEFSGESSWFIVGYCQGHI